MSTGYELFHCWKLPTWWCCNTSHLNFFSSIGLYS